MKTFATIGGACLALLAMSLPALRVEGATKAEQTRAAAKIVEDTLQKEAREGLPDRSELLKPALEQAPEYGPARWHSGYVYDAKRKHWLRPQGVADAAAKDNKLAAYRQAREKSADTFDAQVELARWCANHKLEDQARAHWTRVLQMKPDYEEAIRALVRTANGRRAKDANIAEAKAIARNAATATTKWIPRLEKLRDRAISDSDGQREKAREELLTIRDPDAVEAIDTVFCRQGGELALLGIEILKRIQAPQAATVLAWYAAFSPSPPVRQAAATALRSQEKYDYIPLLLYSMQTPIETGTQQANTSATPSPGVGVAWVPHQTIIRSSQPWTLLQIEGYLVCNRTPQGDPNWAIIGYTSREPYAGPVGYGTPKPTWGILRAVFDTQHLCDSESFTPTPLPTRQQMQNVSHANSWFKTVVVPSITSRTSFTPTPLVGPSSAQPATAQPSPQEAAISQYNAAVTSRNSAVCSALGKATGDAEPASPSEWWAWWHDVNEVYTPSSQGTFRPAQRASAREDTPAQAGDCLAAGTLVRAETGLTPIEKLAVGDRVFACDSQTGCLALKPVLGKTSRAAGRLLKIRAEGEEIQASGGHIFWVAGNGWVKARDLRAGMPLHTIRGTVPVESTEIGTVEKSFSLVAADFDTFLVGKAMVLTHDNTIRRPTTRIVPGL